MSKVVKPVKNREEFLQRYTEEAVDKLHFEIGGRYPKAYLGDQCIFDPDRVEKLLVRPKMNNDGKNRGGLWANEMWEAYLGKECIYRKVKTVENCLASYGYAKQVWYIKGNTNKNRTRNEYSTLNNLYNIDRPGTSTDTWEITDNRYGFRQSLPPVKDLLRPGAFVSQKFHAHTDLSMIQNGGRMTPVAYEERPLDRRYVFGNMMPNTNHKIYAQIGDWFAHNILTAGANISQLFGGVWHGGKSPWTSWIPVMDGVYDDWNFNIGKSNDPGYRAYYDELRSYSTALGGVISSSSINSTSMGSMTINFDDNYLSMGDNLFSNVNRDYIPEKIKIRYCDGTGPRLGDENTYAQGIIPHSAINMFACSVLSQELLDVITTNCLWNECRSVDRMFVDFKDSGRAGFPKAATIWKPAYGCTPYQEVPENTIRLGYHKGRETDLRYLPWEHVPDGPYKKYTEELNKTIYEQEFSSLFPETFLQSSIEDVQVVFDMEYYTYGGLITDEMSWSRGTQTLPGGGVYAINTNDNSVREIRLKNIGNAGYYNFTPFINFSEATIDYMIDHLIDRTNPSQYAYTAADPTYFPTEYNDYYSGIQFYHGLIKKFSKEKWREWGAKAKQKGVCICFAFIKPGHEQAFRYSVEKFKSFPTIFDDESLWT